MFWSFLRCTLCTAIILSLTGIASAGFMSATFSGTGTGSAAGLGGTVTFTQNGDGFLYIKLQNTGTADVLVPSQVMTAFFFDIVGQSSLNTAGDYSFNGAYAKISAGSASYKNGNTLVDAAGTNVGGEWAYQSGMASGVPLGATQGLSSSGLGGLFSAANLNGANLCDPFALDGLQYGILSSNDNLATGNTGVQKDPLIKSSVDFRLGGWNEFGGTQAGFEGLFKKMSFQYGTGAPIGGGYPNVPVFVQEVPVPAGVVLVGIGGALIAAGSYLRQRRMSKLA